MEFDEALREVHRIVRETLATREDMLTGETDLSRKYDSDDLSFSFCPEIERFFGFRIANADWEHAETINDVARLVVEYSKRPRKKIEEPTEFWPKIKFRWFKFFNPGQPDYE